MSDVLQLSPLSELVALQTEKIVANKDSHLLYIGLEHIAQGSPKLLGIAESTSSSSTNSVFAQDDILFGKLRPNLRKSIRAPFAGYCSTDILVLRCLDGVAPAFAGHVFQWEEVFAAASATAAGTKMPRTSWDDLKRFQVFRPSTTAEQSRIAAVLDTMDEAIANTEAVIAKLRQVRTGLLHDLLTRGLDEHGQPRDPIAYPEQFQDSPLGQIPKNWEVIRLGSCAQFVTSGSRGWASYYSDEGALFLRIGNLTREHIDLRLEDFVRVRPPAGSEGARTRVQPGDVLISITADLGIIGVIPEPFEDAYVNQHIALVRPVPVVCSRWIGRYLSFGSTAKFFRMLNDTGAKAGMNLPSIESLLLAIPSREEQDRITSILDSMDADIAEQRRLATKLQYLKSGLMADLLTGRVHVPEGIAVAL